MLDIYYDSRDLRFKSIFGAVQCNTKLEFSIEIHCDVPVSSILYIDNKKLHMQLLSKDAQKHRFTCEYITSQDPGLVYYHFIVSTDYHTVYFGAPSDKLQGLGVLYPQEPIQYRFTVYEAFNTPKWAHGRIMYQIFPDRFYSTEQIPSPYWDRFFHQDWYEEPHIEKDFPSGTMECSDFFGGTLKGITNKLNYLEELGVGIIYLNPIYRAYSNHRYDLAHYMSIDESLGTIDDLIHLCKQAAKKDIYIMLDMVFSHTGSDSYYFNKNNTFDSKGAYLYKKSEFRKWYSFNDDNSYDSWWGISTLPNVNETDPDFMDHVFESIKYWYECGVMGFRLDVADELPGEFLKKLRKYAKSLDPDILILGEVWEDASNKVSYGEHKEYLFGKELDCVMNYPYKDALIAYTLGHIDSSTFSRKIQILMEHYPKQFLDASMVMLGTHDIPRILSILGNLGPMANLPREQQACVLLDYDQYQIALKRLDFILSLFILLPGIPSVYYGDEAGLQGLNDPFNRKTYPWGREDKNVYNIYSSKLKLKAQNEILKYGSLHIDCQMDKLIVKREYKGKSLEFIFDNKDYLVEIT